MTDFSIFLTEGVSVHISYLDSEQFGFVPCNGMVYVRGEEAIVFDTPTDNAGSEKLIRWIEKRWEKRIKAVVINHFHEDCLGGLAAFHAHGIPSYANRLTIELARGKKLFDKRETIKEREGKRDLDRINKAYKVR